MRAEVRINGTVAAPAHRLTWAPSAGQIRLLETGAPAFPVSVTLRNQDQSQGGQLVFSETAAGPFRDELSLRVVADDVPVTFYAAGKFGFPSRDDGDAAIEVSDELGEVLGTAAVMVRVRKNADTLTAAERDRFLYAFARLNNQGIGRFREFRNMHTADTSREAHFEVGFLPWHRAYLLDIERELQSIDASVALPYWRFDEPAPNVFNRAFMGVPNPVSGWLEFAPANPLRLWSTDGQPGILRRPDFDPATEAADVLSEEDTLNLGRSYTAFVEMERDPHGDAHTSFSEGFINSIPSAARDPLFFMLHANVDRLWAKWQWFYDRFDVTSVDSYPYLGQADTPAATRVGHNLLDSMWPWNQITGAPRPNTAPGGNFPASPHAAAPGFVPDVGAMIAYQGNTEPGTRLGFDYDDVPYEASAPVA